jgi:hypothetical protein
MSVMAAIRKREGLQSEIARRCEVSKQAVNKWKRVPLDHIKVVADVTGLPAAALKAEHERADDDRRREREAAWKIPKEEVGATSISDGPRRRKARSPSSGRQATRRQKSN